jgi:hypothetical protein
LYSTYVPLRKKGRKKNGPCRTTLSAQHTMTSGQQSARLWPKQRLIKCINTKNKTKCRLWLHCMPVEIPGDLTVTVSQLLYLALSLYMNISLVQYPYFYLACISFSFFPFVLLRFSLRLGAACARRPLRTQPCFSIARTAAARANLGSLGPSRTRPGPATTAGLKKLVSVIN